LNDKIVLGIITAVIIIGGSMAYFVLIGNESVSINNKQSTINFETTPINLKMKGEGQKIISNQDALFQIIVYEDEYVANSPTGVPLFKQTYFELKPELENIYKEIGVKTETQNTIVVAPIFTMTAYAKSGFYTYFKHECDLKCIQNLPIGYELSPAGESSVNSIRALMLLGYEFITDIEIDKHPEILKNFDKVILLHNEYVTRTEFDALTQHPKVLYLYPNALYAEIEVDYKKNTMTLLRGHGYPESKIKNGFDWKFDNSILEYDNCQENWEFNEIDNGIMLSCYPENIIYKDSALLKMIKDF